MSIAGFVGCFFVFLNKNGDLLVTVSVKYCKSKGQQLLFNSKEPHLKMSASIHLQRLLVLIFKSGV